MLLITRRGVVAAAGTLAAGFASRKLHAEELHSLSSVLKPVQPPVQPPDISFVDADGKEHHLSEFKGHGMVVNFWATWCAPCVAELPSLAALSKTLAPEDVAVLPLSSDRGGAPAVTAFYSQHDISGLPVLLDPKGAASRAWQTRGIPTSVIIDKQGREVARVEGSANWGSPSAAAEVRNLVGV